jgi:signal transduction histidine kinase
MADNPLAWARRGADDAGVGYRAAGPWVGLFVWCRVVATAVAAALLLFHRVTDHDGVYALVVVVYGLGSAAATGLGGRPARLPLVWAADMVATLALVVAGGTWRSPVYLLALTALILPATSGPSWRGLLATGLFTAGFLGIALFTGVDWGTLETTPRLETFSTHLILPIVLGIGLTQGAELLRRLHREQERSSRLALEGERKRLARELHDSAKQRLHAAHLVLSSLPRQPPPADGDPVELALSELEAAAREMDSSLADLRSTDADTSLLGAVLVRAARLADATGIAIDIDGEDPGLSGARATHVYHVISEAMTNAVRHGRPSRVIVSFGMHGETFTAEVLDDGVGLPPDSSWESLGIRSMVERAELLGGRLEIGGGPGEAGTRVLLAAPVRSRVEVPR